MYTDLDGLAFYLDPITAFGESMKSLIEALKEGDSEKAGTNIFKSMLSAVNTLIPPLTSIEYLFNRFAPDDIKQKVLDFFNKIGTKATEIWEIVSGFFKMLGDDFYTYVFEPIADKVVALWEKVVAVVTWVATLVHGLWIIIKAGFIVVWEYFISVLELAKSIFMAKVVTPIKSALQILKGYFNVGLQFIISIVKLIWEKVSKVVTDINNWIYDNITEPVLDWIVSIFAKITEFFTKSWENVVKFVTDVWNKIKTDLIDPVTNKVKNAAQWLYDNFIKPTVDKFNQAVEDIKNAFSTLWEDLKTGAKGFFNRVLEWFETAINWIIDKINDFVGNFNFAVKAAATITGDHWSDLGKLNHIDIPGLATGAVIPPNAPFLAMLGDQRSGTNVEAPLDTIKQAVIEAMASGGFGIGGDINVVCELDGREIARAVVRQNELYRRSTGRSMI